MYLSRTTVPIFRFARSSRSASVTGPSVPRVSALFFVVWLAGSLAGCHSTSVEVVRAHAADDFACAESKVQVTPEKDKGSFRAEGCGKHATYTCEGWDSYNQAPVCSPNRR